MEENKILKNIPLKNYTSYKIGGPAKYFFVADTASKIAKAIKAAKELKTPVFILGGGSNVLFSDKGFKGMVVQIANSAFEIKNQNEIQAGAGSDLTKLAYFAAENGLSGIEWAAGIPGTLGGAIFGCAQAFGSKISDSIKSVEALEIKTGKVKKFSKEQCKFSLKNSIFKKSQKYVLISVVLRLQPAPKDEIALKIKKFLEYRKTNHPLNFPSAGSTFVNPEIKSINKKFLEKIPEIERFKESGVVPAGFLIQKAGLCGKVIGGAQISEKHCNFIINLGDAKAQDVIRLVKMAQKSVRKNFGIKLEPEIRIK